MKIALSFMLIGLLLGSAVVRADNVTNDEVRLAKILGLKVTDITPAPIPGLYTVTIGPQLAYITADGRYIIRGDIIDVHNGDNLTASSRAQMRLVYLQKIGTADMIVFSPSHPRHTITVLTDIDCQYCRVFEHDRPTLNAMGIAVQYLFYPDDGIGSLSWHKAMAVWCASDRKSALTAAKYAMRYHSYDGRLSIRSNDGSERHTCNHHRSRTSDRWLPATYPTCILA
jgi:thiol:disulfide interchange protein DsbC